MLSRITRLATASVLTGLLILTAVVPSFSLASTYGTDSDLAVYPESDVLVFPNLRPGDTMTKSFIIENTGDTEKTVDLVTLPLGAFSYAGSRSIVIPAHEERLLPIVFSPSSTSAVQSQFTLRSSNTGEHKELTVRGNVDSTLTNDGIEISTTDLEFPDTGVGEVTEATIAFTNNNSFNLDVNVTRTPNEPFRIVSAREFTVFPGETGYLRVTFTPNREILYNGSIRLETNERTSRNVIVQLEGRGSEDVRGVPEAVFTPTTNFISLGTISTDEQQTENVRIFNAGNDDLEVEIEENTEYPFTVDMGSSNKTRAMIMPGREGVIRVQFKPEYAGNFRSTFRVTTNASNVEEMVYTVSGNAVQGREARVDLDLTSGVNDRSIHRYESAEINFKTQLPARVRVDIEQSGNHVTTLRTEAQGVVEPGRTNHVVWTGKDSSGNRVTPGLYSYVVTAYSNVDGQIEEDSGTIRVETPMSEGRVSRVVPEDEFFSVSDANINIDRGEKTYFNFMNFTSSDVKFTIKDKRNNRKVLIRTYTNVAPGTHNWEFNWDGRSSRGNKVSEGDYRFEFEISPRPCTGLCLTIHYPERVYNGVITVSRNSSHIDEPIVRTLAASHTPVVREGVHTAQLGSPYYGPSNNESLITQLEAYPSYISEFNKNVVASFNTLHNGSVTAVVKDQYGDVVRKLTINRPVVDGYHHQELTWDTITSDQEPAQDGKYTIEVSTLQYGETDTDAISVTINRGFHGRTEPEVLFPVQMTPQEEENFRRMIESTSPRYKGSCTNFVDVHGDAAFCEAVAFAVDQGIFEGSIVNGERLLRPDDYLTRAEATAVVLRIMKLPLVEYNQHLDGNLGFVDLDPNAWYMEHIKTIVKSATQQQSRYGSWVRNIMQGYPDGTIRPNQVMSRAEFYKVFLEAAQNSAAVRANFALDYHVTEAPFSDTAVNELTDWYLPYAKWAATHLNHTPFAEKYFDNFELAEGVRRFKGKKGITRGEVIDLIFATQALGLINY